MCSRARLNVFVRYRKVPTPGTIETMGLAIVWLVRQFMGSTLEMLNVNYLFPDGGPGKCQTDAILDFEKEEMLPFYLMDVFESIKHWQHQQERGNPDIYLFFYCFLYCCVFFLIHAEM